MSEAEKESWFQSLIKYEIDNNWDSAKDKVNYLLKENPNADIDDLVNKIINDKAFWAAMIGIGIGGLQAVPAIGQALAIGSVAPEAVYLASLFTKDGSREVLKRKGNKFRGLEVVWDSDVFKVE
jgi:hypothetical protein